MTERKQANEAFGEWARKARDGRALRALARVTGISHTYIDDMEWGKVPSYPLLEQFVERLELPPDLAEEGFRLAGYRRKTMESNADIWTRALADLAREFNKDRIVVNFSGGLERLNELTREELQALIDDQRAELEEEAAGLLDPKADKEALDE
jgi:hypothetical protein